MRENGVFPKRQNSGNDKIRDNTTANKLCEINPQSGSVKQHRFRRWIQYKSMESLRSTFHVTITVDEETASIGEKF